MKREFLQSLGKQRGRPVMVAGAVLAVGSLAAYTPARSVANASPAVALPVRVVADSIGTSAAAARAEAALAVLGKDVAPTSDADALRTAFRAYYSYREAHAAEVRKPYLYFVDLGLDNATPRGWVFDMDSLAVVDGPFPVAHGRGSGPRNGVPTRFSNAAGTYTSSLGLYLAQEKYTFTGKSGGRRYSSTGLKLRGESGAFNGAARPRGVVAHGAPYVTSREAGRSEGCPAMEVRRAGRLLPLIANGGVVFLYSPRDARWLAEDPWIHAADAGAVGAGAEGRAAVASATDYRGP